MSDNSGLLNDFNSIMEAAKNESILMNEDKVVEPNPAAGDLVESPKSPEVPNVGGALNNNNVANMLNRMAQNPSEMAKVMEESAAQMTPEMMEEARRLAMGGQGEQIIKEMQRRGMDINAMRAQLMEQQKSMKGLSSKTDNMKKAILITSNRQVKQRTVPLTGAGLVAETILKSPKVVELSCSRLAIGVLQGKTIKVWCDPERKGKNKRLSKILGFPMAGEGLIVMQESDLEESVFLEVEKALTS